MRVLIRDAERPLVQVELAQEDSTRSSQPLDDRAVPLGYAVSEDARSARRAHTRGVVKILQRDRDPVKRAAIDAVRKIRIGALRFRERALGREGDEGAELAVMASDAIEAGAHEIDG